MNYVERVSNQGNYENKKGESTRREGNRIGLASKLKAKKTTHLRGFFTIYRAECFIVRSFSRAQS